MREAAGHALAAFIAIRGLGLLGFAFAGGIALGVNVTDLLELQRALQRDGIAGAATAI